MEKDERIRARRARIEADFAAKQQAMNGDDGRYKRKPTESDKPVKTASEVQISQSRNRIEKIRAAGEEQISMIRVSGDMRENQRRVEEETKKKMQKQWLEEDSERSEAINASIAMKWPELYQLTTPQALLKAVEHQRGMCDDVLAGKDELIRAYHQELKALDDAYVKSLKHNADDIDQLLEKMSSMMSELNVAHKEELKQIESVLAQTRKEVLEKNRIEMDNLFEKRRALEVKFMDARQERMEENAQQLANLRTNDGEVHAVLKIKLETEIQNLEQQLQAMRATYQLNTEKLEYNFSVLTERDAENSHTIAQHKRKLARLTDVLSGLMAKYQTQDNQYRQENMDLTDEYKRITEQFKDLQAKFRHFQTADNNKFRDVWSVNEDMVADLMSKVMMADRVIHEQHLGKSWQSADPSFFEKLGTGPAAAAVHQNMTASTRPMEKSPIEEETHTAAPAPADGHGGTSRKQEREFWERMSGVVSDDTFRLWKALSRGLEQYKDILTDRSQLIDDTARLRRQNSELKMVLNSYLQQ